MRASTVQDETITVAKAAEKTGVTAHTLRNFERIGRLDVGRQAGGHRRFTEHDIDRVVFMGRPRATAMAIRDVQRRFTIVAAGPATEDERLALLDTRASVQARRPRARNSTGCHRAQDHLLRRVTRALTRPTDAKEGGL